MSSFRKVPCAAYEVEVAGSAAARARGSAATVTLDFSRSKNVRLMCHESSRREELVCSVECPSGGGRTFVCEIRPAASAGGGMTVAMGVEVQMQAEAAAAAAAASGALVPPPPPKRRLFVAGEGENKGGRSLKVCPCKIQSQTH